MDELNVISPNNKSIRADAARNRQRLLETANRLFRENNIESVTMSEVAKAANVGKGTLYRHFSDKAALCHALLDEAMRDFQNRTLKHLNSNDTSCNKLRWFLCNGVSYVVDNLEVLREAAIQQSQGDMLTHPAHTWWRQTIYSLLEQSGQHEQVHYLADTLYVLLHVRTIQMQLERGYTTEQIVAGLLLTLERLTAGVN